MDAGLAALLGTGIGGVLGAGGTLGAAYLTGRTQGRSQHVHWRRQGRRDAYSNLIAAVTAFRHETDLYFGDRDREAPPEQLAHRRERMEGLWAAIRAAVPVVLVEGPADVADQAMKIDHCAENVIINLDLAEGGTGGHFAEAHSNLVAINWGLPEFAELARNALDTPDSKTLPEPQD